MNPSAKIIRTAKIAARTFGGLFSKKGDAGKDGMSSFQALATAIAAQVGTGNIAGAATAIAVGGPGAIFWMWISAFLGMSTIFAEAVMAQKFKQVSDDGTNLSSNRCCKCLERRHSVFSGIPFLAKKSAKSSVPSIFKTTDLDKSKLKCEQQANTYKCYDQHRSC